MKCELDTIIDGQRYLYRADNKDDLIAALYADGHTGKIDGMIAIMLTDIVEVMYGDDEPGIFSWTEGIKKI